MYLIEYEFPDRTQLDRTIAISRIEAERRAQCLVDSGAAQFARLIPIRRGRAIIIKRKNGGAS